MYCCLRQHGVILNLGLAQWGAVAGDENQLGYSGKRQKVSQKDLLSFRLQSSAG